MGPSCLQRKQVTAKLMLDCAHPEASRCYVIINIAIERIRTAVLDMKVVQRRFLEVCIVGETSSSASVERKLTGT